MKILIVPQNIFRKASLELKSEELRIFNYMICTCDFENWINVLQADISKEIEVSIPSISKSLRGLREKSYIEVIKKSGLNYYRLNPDVALEDKVEDQKKFIDFKNASKKLD